MEKRLCLKLNIQTVDITMIGYWKPYKKCIPPEKYMQSTNLLRYKGTTACLDIS